MQLAGAIVEKRQGPGRKEPSLVASCPPQRRRSSAHEAVGERPGLRPRAIGCAAGTRGDRESASGARSDMSTWAGPRRRRGVPDKDR
ncbi:hypothetical protein NDU88_001358 [Pleurodeles waltl]|uniref:Uncharacterized protein n=1 Tax=Pleurodeles waltl TaxID=8319 RepID=A0AAV7MJI3_PLEWA|nr:hypothetical protein NDU88_001358 [Pleurodeles waltl]